MNRMHSKNNIKFIFLWLILFYCPVSLAKYIKYIWIWIVNAIFYNEVYKEK